MADTQTQTRRITISVDTKGATELKQLSDQLGGINKNTKSLSDSIDYLSNAAKLFIAGLSIHKLTEFSDQIQEIHERLVVFTGDQFSATKLLDDLEASSRRTNQTLKSTSDTFFLMSNSLKEAKLSSTSLLELTETLIQSFRLSGKSAAEAQGAISALSASFQLGAIRSRDLRNILKENQVLGQALRKEFGNNILSATQDGFLTTAKFAEILYKNMGDINARAKVLGSTFSESATKALDAFKIKVFEINEALGLSAGFAASTDKAIKNMGTIVTVGTILAVSTLPAIIVQVYKLAAALLALAPGAAILTGGLILGLTAVTAAFGDSSDIGALVVQLKAGFSELKAIFDDLIAKLYDFLAWLGKLAPSGSAASSAMKTYQDLAKASRQAAQDSRAHAQALHLEYDAQQAYNEQQAAAANAAARHAQDLEKLNKAFHPDLSPEQLLAGLNAEFTKGRITVNEYADALQKVDIKAAQKKFRDGKIDLEKYNDTLRSVKTYELNQQLREGVLTFQQYDDAIRKVKLDKLNEDLDAGRISLEAYNHQLASVSNQFSASGAFRTGLQDYVSAIGTTTQQVAGLITHTFQNLEDQLVNFVKKGKFDFAQFTQAILDDLLRIIIRMSIIQPLANGLLGAFTSTPTSGGGNYGAAGGSYGDVSGTAAHGAIFDGSVAKFANGGVVSRPTLFKYGSGSTGLMGEAGAEAIVPLSRGRSGDLGVKASLTPVNINIVNQSGGEVSQKETTGPNGERTIEILIAGKVKDGIANGTFDKSFNSAFGLRRKGT